VKKPGLNLVGPQVRKWRTRKGWFQERLASKLQLQGWSVSRHSLAKLELGLRRMPDCEVLFLARVLGVNVNLLFPRELTLKRLGPAFQSGARLALFPTRAEK
jgi:transcriptional regulator with XRE-family HTH domain